MRVDDLLEALGLPQSRAEFGLRAIYRYPDCVVTLEDGEVTDIQWRDAAAETADASRRALLKAQQEQAAARAEWEARYRQEHASRSRSTRYYGPYAGAYGHNPEIARQHRITLLQDRVNAEKEMLRRYSRQSSFSNSGTRHITPERAELARTRIRVLEQEILRLKQGG